jgi:hypothetical protein
MDIVIESYVKCLVCVNRNSHVCYLLVHLKVVPNQVASLNVEALRPKAEL